MPPKVQLNSGPETLAFPRILCLHGGGVSAQVFSLQMSWMKPLLVRKFRLVFVDGPVASEMHEDLYPVYSNLGPYRCWARWQSHQKRDGASVAVASIDRQLRKTMAADAGTGEWVGLLGFSQGAKMAFSILLENQLRRTANSEAGGFAGVHWKFGILLACAAPPFALSDLARGNPRFLAVGELATDETYAARDKAACSPEILLTPVLQVSGVQDDATASHHELVTEWCTRQTALLVEWDGGHRLPTKATDVAAVTDGVFEIAKVSLPGHSHHGFPSLTVRV